MANPHPSVKGRKHGVPNKMSSARVERSLARRRGHDPYGPRNDAPEQRPDPHDTCTRKQAVPLGDISPLDPVSQPRRCRIV